MDVKVHPDTIRYFNESITLFNPNEKEDSDKAQALAEQDAQTHASEMGILELANQQAETLEKGILEGCVLDYEIKFKKQKLHNKGAIFMTKRFLSVILSVMIIIN